LNALAHLHKPENINGFRVSGVDKQTSANALKKGFFGFGAVHDVGHRNLQLVHTMCGMSVCCYVGEPVWGWQDKTRQVNSNCWRQKQADTPLSRKKLTSWGMLLARLTGNALSRPAGPCRKAFRMPAKILSIMSATTAVVARMLKPYGLC